MDIIIVNHIYTLCYDLRISHFYYLLNLLLYSIVKSPSVIQLLVLILVIIQLNKISLFLMKKY